MPSHEPTDIVAEFQIDGSYVDTYSGEDLTARVRGGDSVRISRGLADQQSATSPTTCNFTLNNRDGLFSDGNPLSPLYGKLGLATRCRIGIQAGGTWDEYLRMPDWGDDLSTLQNAVTADKASLDITGDIDVRVEFAPYYQRADMAGVLAAKYILSGDQRSWILTYQENGTVTFRHSPDGTFASLVTVNSGVVMVEPYAGRRAVRVTVDVNNGSGGRTTRFYTADSIAGPWVETSNLAVGSTTSIYASTADLEIGSANGGAGALAGTTPFRGKIYAVEVYSGIAGTLVADFKPAGKGIEARTWVDTCASPNTWDVVGEHIRLASDRIRVSGEINSLPEDWDVTGNDRWVLTSMQGIVGRYSSNKAPLRGAIYRNYRNYPGIVGYWPMEDAAGATVAASAIPDAAPGNITQCTFGGTTGLDGSTGAITLNSAPNGSKIILTTKTPAFTGETSLIFYFKLASLPGSDSTLATVYTTGGGTANRWTIAVGATGFAFSALDQHGTVVDTGSSLFGTGASPLDQWIGMALKVTANGANVDWETTWHAVGTDTFYTHFLGGDSFAGSMRQFQKVEFGTPSSAFQGAQIAHVIISSTDFDLATARFRDASKAYAGERFIRRGIRLAEEEDVTFEWLGDPDASEICGPQAADTLFNILDAGAKVDGGILTDIRDTLGFYYISHHALSRRYGPEFDYAASHLAATPRPVGDRRFTVNDFTASRPSGSSARYEATDDRRKNVRDPDDPDSPGVGRFERGESFSVATDDQLPGQAQRRVSRGTWERPHIPTLAVDPHRSEIHGDAVLFGDVIAMDAGGGPVLTGLDNAPMAPDDVEMLALGYTETFSNKLWSLVFNTTPAGPYRTPAFGGQGGAEPRLDAWTTEVHTSQAGVSTGATEIRVRTPRKTADNLTEPCWIDSTNYSAEFPVDIKIAGERMTLTACTAADGNAELVAAHFENADFTTYWLASGGTVAQSNTFAQAGTYSARLTVAGSPTQAYIYPDTATAAPRVSPGDSITFSGWVRVAVNQTDVRMTADWLDENGGYLSTSDSGAAGLTSAAGWVQRSFTATAPAGAHYVHYHPTILSSPSNGTLLYMDNLAITNNSVNYQTMTVTRGVNLGGTGKALADGDKPYLFEQHYLGFS